MGNLRHRNIIFLFPVIMLGACSSKPEKRTDEEVRALKEPLVEINKELVEMDEGRIKAYVQRRNWNMKKSQTGLWYMIYEHGNGDSAAIGKVAEIKFTISLLDGTVCYTSDSLGEKIFRIHLGNVETGLEEGILFMQEGDKARFIMPPHLAHGLLGDRKKIPPRETILYDVELINLYEPG